MPVCQTSRPYSSEDNMHTLLHKLGTAIISFGLAIGSFLGVQQPDYTSQITALQSQIKSVQTQSPALGAYNPSGGGTYRLQSSVGTTNTTVPLSSFKEPISNIPYTMSYLNSSIMYGTLDPQTSRSEFISFTGITQNSDGTAILTGVTRGLGRSYPYTASSTLRQAHSGQSIFILSDSPQHFEEYGVLQNDQTITGDWHAPTPATDNSIATRAYVDGKTFGGIGGASETATGTVEIATSIEAASSTTNGSLGRLALPASLATSTYNSATAALRVVVTKNSGKIDDNFISTSTLFTNIASSTKIGNTYAFDIGKHMQVFTSDGTFTVPSGIRTLRVQTIGGGGGGGNSGGHQGAGGAGGYSLSYVDVTGTSSIKITIGLGGGTGNPGTAGTATLFSTYASSTGGNPGSSSSGGTGGVGHGDLNMTGGTGGNEDSTDSTNGVGGLPAYGGASYGKGGDSNGAGVNGAVIVEY